MNRIISNWKNMWKRYSRGDKIYLAIVYVILIFTSIACLYPIYFTVVASFSDAYEIYKGNVFFWPKGITAEAYKHVLQESRIWTGYANTILYTVVGTLFNLFLTIPAAYGLSKRNVYGSGFLMTLFVITMYFGGGMVPTYILMKNMNLLDTRVILIIINGLSVYNLIVTRTYFRNNIPESLFEAAKIDGANEFRTFIQIALPLSAPIIAVITLYYTVAHWNSYFSALIYVNNQDYHPLQLVLRDILIKSQTAFETLMEQGGSEQMMADAAKRAHLAATMKYALVFISSAPMLILYPFIQKHFVKGMMVGSVKG